MAGSSRSLGSSRSFGSDISVRSLGSDASVGSVGLDEGGSWATVTRGGRSRRSSSSSGNLSEPSSPEKRRSKPACSRSESPSSSPPGRPNSFKAYALPYVELDDGQVLLLTIKDTKCVAKGGKDCIGFVGGSMSGKLAGVVHSNPDRQLAYRATLLRECNEELGVSLPVDAGIDAQRMPCFEYQDPRTKAACRCIGHVYFADVGDALLRRVGWSAAGVGGSRSAWLAHALEALRLEVDDRLFSARCRAEVHSLHVLTPKQLHQAALDGTVWSAQAPFLLATKHPLALRDKWPTFGQFFLRDGSYERRLQLLHHHAMQAEGGATPPTAAATTLPAAAGTTPAPAGRSH